MLRSEELWQKPHLSHGTHVNLCPLERQLTFSMLAFLPDCGCIFNKGPISNHRREARGVGGLGFCSFKPLTLRPIRLPMDPEMAVKMMAYKERQDANLQRCANKIRWFLDLLLWLLKYILSRIVDRTEWQVGGRLVAAGKRSDSVMF